MLQLPHGRIVLCIYDFVYSFIVDVVIVCLFLFAVPLNYSYPNPRVLTFVSSFSSPAHEMRGRGEWLVRAFTC